MKLFPTLVFSLLVIISAFANEGPQPAWGQTGHRTIGEVATEHLTNKAKKRIEKLLDGQSLALVSTFGDDIKVSWHYKKSNLHRVWDTQMIESWNSCARPEFDLPRCSMRFTPETQYMSQYLNT